jgi:hypothetical protein
VQFLEGLTALEDLCELLMGDKFIQRILTKIDCNTATYCKQNHFGPRSNICEMCGSGTAARISHGTQTVLTRIFRDKDFIKLSFLPLNMLLN